MSIGLILALLAVTALALAALLAPMWRMVRQEPRRAYELRVHQDQLRELVRDQERGLIGAEEARAARVEIERRLLRSADEPVAPARATSGRRVGLVAAALLPPFALLLYLHLGRPDLPDLPLLARPQPVQPDIGRMVAQLEARLQAEPGDARGWLMLGRSKAALGDQQAATAAYRRALALAPDDPEAVAGIADALTAAAGGVVTPEALALYQRLDTLAPGEPRASYYQGLAAAQAGDFQAALDRWRTLLAATQADAPWRPTVVAAVENAAKRLGIDPAPITALQADPALAGLSPEAAAIAALPAAERETRIRAMVDGLAQRLAADGSDLGGWVQLARARTVLGEPDAARDAWRKALALAPTDAGIQKGLADALLGPPPAGSDLPLVPDEAAGLYADILTRTPDDPEPRWYLGIHALQTGNPAEAGNQWRQLLAELDPKHPDYAEIDRRLKALPGG